MRKLSLVIWLTPLLRMTSPGKMAGIMVTLLLMIVPVNEVSAQVVEEWVARYVTGFSYTVIAPQIGLDSNGNIYVLGGGVPTIIKYNPDGTQLWELNPGGINLPRGRAIEVDAAGNVYYAAIPPTGPGNYNVDIFKYNTDGAEVWTTRTNVGTYPVGDIVDIALDGNFNMIVVGDIGGPKNDPDDFYDENHDYYVMKFDGNGNKLWAQRIGATNVIGYMYNDKPEGLAVDPSGNVYVTGSSGGGRLMANSRYFTAKLDANGNHAWSAFYSSPSVLGIFSEARAIAVDNGGNVYVTGMSRGIGMYDWATVKYDTNGNELWAARVEGTGWDAAEAIAVDNNSNVYVTGNIAPDFGTVKYDTSGNELWQSTYAYGASDRYSHALDMALDAQGSVYVTGWSQDISYDYATVGYDTNGDELWSIRYTGTSDTGWDWPYSIAADNNGNVYVTGASDSSEGNEDIVTIKYSQEAVVGNTPAGSDVEVTVDGVTITFENVEEPGGDTTVTESDTGPALPAGSEASCAPAVYYDITTTAPYTGTIEVCLTYDDAVCDESDMHLFAYEGGTWVDVTTSVDTVANIICGEVTSLSVFLLVTPVEPAPVVVDDLVSVSMGRVGYDRRTGQFSVSVTVTNTSATAIGNPVWLVIESISSPSVTVANGDGTTADGKEYLDLSGLLGDGQLDPGESATTRIYFNNPSRVRFTFEPSVRGMI